MGLFDFLKPRSDRLRELEKKPVVRKVMLEMKLEFLQKQIANLRAVGREADADKAITTFLLEVLQEWKREPHNPIHLSTLANSAIMLGALEAGKGWLKIVIEENEKTPFLDLTTVYMDLGRIYHRLRNNPEKELWCYHMATEAIPPNNCKFPATKRHKAKAHNFAYMCANRIGNQEHVEFHDRKRRELAPEVNWDDAEHVLKLVQEQ